MIRGGVSSVLGKSRKGNLSEKFFMPPFTALLARDGAWQQRKNMWLALGMKSEAGRMEAKKTCLPSGIMGGNVGDIEISIFDPVLAEISYRWFCPAGGQVVDPFSGGSVRGIVASVLGYKYWGCDLSAEQVEANKRQGAELCDPPMPEWVRGDSREMLAGAPEADFIFSCHPASVRILTETRGAIPINEIRIGERVITHTGKLQEVSACLNRHYTGKILSISRDYRRGLPLLVTEEHPLLIKRIDAPAFAPCRCGCGELTDRHYRRGHNNKCHNGRWGVKTAIGEATDAMLKESRAEVIKWLSASCVRVGDYLLEPLPEKPEMPVDQQVVWCYDAPARSSRGRRPNGPTEVRATAEVCRLVGYYLAEGFAPGGGVGFAFHKKEIAFHEDVISAWRSIFGGAATLRQNSGNGITISCSGVIGAQFLRTAGTNAGNKAFPQWVWSCSDALLAEVVKCAWRGDGWMTKDDRSFGFASVSERLIEDIRRALLRFGIVASLRRRAPRSTNYCAMARAQWNIIVRGVYAVKLAQLFGVEFPVSKKRQRPGRSPSIVDGYVQYRIKSIVASSVSDFPVYNLEVDEDHSFVADGVCSHNCPPYGDLEVYSNDPADLSNMEHSDFLRAYADVVEAAAAKLKNNRFACFVVGDYRDKDGFYRSLPAKTVKVFEMAGLRYYNEAILITVVGSAFLRTHRPFVASRKLAKMHQNVLTFVKGDPKVAAAEIEEAGTVARSVSGLGVMRFLKGAKENENGVRGEGLEPGQEAVVLRQLQGGV